MISNTNNVNGLGAEQGMRSKKRIRNKSSLSAIIESPLKDQDHYGNIYKQEEDVLPQIHSTHHIQAPITSG